MQMKKKAAGAASGGTSHRTADKLTRENHQHPAWKLESRPRAGGTSGTDAAAPVPASSHPNVITKDRLRRLIVNKLLEKERGRKARGRDGGDGDVYVQERVRRGETGVMWKRVAGEKPARTKHAGERVKSAPRPKQLESATRRSRSAGAPTENPLQLTRSVDVATQSLPGASSRHRSDSEASKSAATRIRPGGEARVPTSTGENVMRNKPMAGRRKHHAHRSVKTQTGGQTRTPVTGGEKAAPVAAAGGGTRLFMEMPFVVGKVCELGV